MSDPYYDVIRPHGGILVDRVLRGEVREAVQERVALCEPAAGSIPSEAEGFRPGEERVLAVMEVAEKYPYDRQWSPRCWT